MNVISQDAFAKIAVNKSLLKEYSSSQYQRVVYLNDQDEFQIQLYNPTSKIIAAKIFLNGEPLNDMLVLRPAERVWLERFLENSIKFRFSTYEVDNTAEAERITKQNGEVKIQFFDVREPVRTSGITYNTNITSWPPVNVYYTSTSGECMCNKSLNDSLSVNSISIAGAVDSADNVCYYSASVSDCGEVSASSSIAYSAATSLCSCDVPSTMETGRVEKGSYSNQKFSYVDYDFNSWPFRTETISILPASRKPVTSTDLKKKYCSNCGRKLSPKHKFCPYCGTKVD